MCIIFNASRSRWTVNKFFHSEVNILIQHIIVQDQDGQNNNIDERLDRHTKIYIQHINPSHLIKADWTNIKTTNTQEQNILGESTQFNLRTLFDKNFIELSSNYYIELLSNHETENTITEDKHSLLPVKWCSKQLFLNMLVVRL